MPSPHAASQDRRRRAAIRSALLVVGAAAALTSGLASAVGFTWGSDIATYNTFAASCYANGVCPAPILQPNSSVLFSWGTVTNPTRNSVTTWTNTGAPFVLGKISITATASGIGSGDFWATGTGAAPAWEWSANAENTKFGESLMQIKVGTNAAQTVALFTGPPYNLPAGENWYDTGDTRQTPIDATFNGGSGLTIGTGTTIEFRLFETDWQGGNQNIPDLVFAPMTIDIQPLANTLSASNVVGNVRMGTTGTLTATVANSGTAVATGVALSAVAAPFAPTSGQALGNIAASGTANGTFQYTPQYTGGGAFPTDQTSVAITSVDAGGGSFTITGNGVGPVFNLSGDGVSGLNVDLGSVEVGKTALYDLALDNLFLTPLGADNALSDLTIINVGISDGSSPVQVQGLPAGWFVIHAQGAGGTAESFSLAFTPTTVGAITPLLLTFGTDVNGALYNPASPSAPSTNYVVRITGMGVPAPATLALFGLGMALMRFHRGRALIQA